MRPPLPGAAGRGGKRRSANLIGRTIAPAPSVPQAPSPFLLDEPRQMRPDELPAVRAVWWHLAAQGIRMPAERGVIRLDAETGITTKQTEAPDVESYSDF